MGPETNGRDIVVDEASGFTGNVVANRAYNGGTAELVEELGAE
jgi:hypothetical protein